MSPHKSWSEAEQQLEAFASHYRILEKKMKVLGTPPAPPPSLRGTQTNDESASSSPTRAKKGALVSESPLRPDDSESEEENEEEYDEASDG